jgi:hypothetical protein
LHEVLSSASTLTRTATISSACNAAKVLCKNAVLGSSAEFLVDREPIGKLPGQGTPFPAIHKIALMKSQLLFFAFPR